MEEAPLVKKQKTESKTIGTHSGTFHCDEALACFLLRQLPEYKDATIVRTRDPSVLATLDILVDVGAEYIPEKNRFDHHQRGFVETLDAEHKTKLSSAGLIYKHFGKQVIKELAGTDEENTELLFQRLYKDFIEAIDAIDNGISQYPDEVPPRYVNHTSLSSRVGHLNAAWNDPNPDDEAGFKKAMEMAGSEFVDALKRLQNSWLPAREIVKRALLSRDKDFNTTNSEVMLLDHFCPWKEHLQQLEAEYKIEPLIKYVLFSDSGSTWRIQAVSITPDSFQNRLSLPEPWRGLRDEELSKVANIEGCVFVHASGFIGGHKTKEGVILMAQKALEMAKQ